VRKTGFDASLFGVSSVRVEDGSSLSVDDELHRGEELSVFFQLHRVRVGGMFVLERRRGGGAF
jgi:hypothetical protein